MVVILTPFLMFLLAQKVYCLFLTILFQNLAHESKAPSRTSFLLPTDASPCKSTNGTLPPTPAMSPTQNLFDDGSSRCREMLFSNDSFINEYSTGDSAATPTISAPPGLEGRPRCIYVGNLDPRVTEFHLRDMFSEAGPISFAKIISDKNLFRAGFKYGFVEYENSESAETALMLMNGKVVYGAEIKVNWAYASMNPERETSLFHVFVGDLSQDVNDYVLAKAFSGFQSFCEARIMWDFLTGRSRGFGFVAFKDKVEAEQAISSMSGVVIGGRPIFCNWASYRNKDGMSGFESVSSQTHPSNSTVYIGNLPPGTSNLKIEEFLTSHGFSKASISSIKIYSDRDFCFVKFDFHETAVECILRLHGVTLIDKELKCHWGKDRGSICESSSGAANIFYKSNEWLEASSTRKSSFVPEEKYNSKAEFSRSKSISFKAGDQSTGRSSSQGTSAFISRSSFSALETE